MGTAGPRGAHLPISGPSLADLPAAAARGERDGLRAINQRQSVRLSGVANTVLRDRDQASDAVHHAFINIARRAGQFDPMRGTPEAWLAAVVRYAALDMLRARGRETPSDDPALGDTPVEPEALAALETQENGTRLKQCLEALPEKNRRGIVLAFVHGLSHPQNAERLELPLGTVKAWIRRGLLSLRECMA